jgi:hypothetical protein
MTNLGIEPKSAGKDDPRNKKEIRFHILYEAYERDKEANELYSSNHEILLTTIQKKYHASGNIEEYRKEAREMAMKENSLIEFVGDTNEDTLRVTDKGIKYYEANREHLPSNLDL